MKPGLHHGGFFFVAPNPLGNATFAAWKANTMELYKIYHEDCIEGMKRIPDGSVDMVLCDFPFQRTKIR